MILSGSLINGGGIALGWLAGLAFGRHLTPAFRDQALRLIGLTVVVIGIKMAWVLPDPVLVLVSLVGGGWIGSRLGIDAGLERLGRWAERRAGGGAFVQGFVTATLIFNVGAMAIVGAVQAGLGQPPVILETKAVLDGVTAMVLTAAAGWSVGLAAPVTVVYEGLLSLLAGVVAGHTRGPVVTEITVVGGFLVAAIGVNLLTGRMRLAVGDLLPALVLAGLLAAVPSWMF